MPQTLPTKPAVGTYEKPQGITPTKTFVEGVQTDLEQQVRETKDISTETKDYKEILKEAEISLDEATSIVDDMLMHGFYQENVPLTKKVSITLRTRTQADYLRYVLALEALSPRFVDQMQELMIRYFLAGSLVRFGDKTFAHPDRAKEKTEDVMAAFDARLEWIEAQPERIIALLAQKLNAFDKKVSIVLSEGVANFI